MINEPSVDALIRKLGTEEEACTTDPESKRPVLCAGLLSSLR